MAGLAPLEVLKAGMQILVGDRVWTVPADLAASFMPGDKLCPVERTGQVLVIRAEEQAAATEAVDRSERAFRELCLATDDQITGFFASFAERLDDDSVWQQVAEVNAKDVERAAVAGRSTTRLISDDRVRRSMIEGLHAWSHAPSRRGQTLETIDHDGWSVELLFAPLGIVGFVFEGRPNVVADATGVLRGGNAVVFRIGRDALQTAQTIMRLAVRPALIERGLPESAVTLIDRAEHGVGWALFRDRRLALAVARGSGPAVETLSSIASSAGVPVSAHGTGGAWIVIDATATKDDVCKAIERSLDRKVCNTVNVITVPRSGVDRYIPAILDGLGRAATARGESFKLHVTEGSESYVPAEWFERRVPIRRASGVATEPQAETLPMGHLGHEWEWEASPEVTLTVADPHEAVDLFNRYSPRFVASLLSADEATHRWFYDRIEAPFVGNSHTRWVDGQVALRRPELGLSNWQYGRLLGRGGILSGDSIFTIRTRARHRR